MSGFTQIFGGSTIAPANASFLALQIAADKNLAWPIEQAIDGDVVADTIEVNATAPGLSINMPDARQVSTGYTTCFNNVGANTVTIRDAASSNLLSLLSGTTWILYLADNTTEAGTWRVFQLGASVSVAVAAALAGPGLKAIVTALGQDIQVTSTAATPTTLVDGDRAKFINWTGGLGTINLPNAGTVGNGWFVQIRNSGSGDLTVTPPSGTIDGAASKTFAAGTSSVVLTDGTNYFTLGFGSGAAGGSSFDFVEINVAGSGTFALSGANLNRKAYRFIGVLTGNRTIEVPAAIQEYWIANATTGAFSLFVKTAAQAAPGIEVLQSSQAILYCDGTNVIDAESSSISFPLPVAQGGTGAVTASAARTNLGAGTAGANIFTSGTQADAQTALGLALAAANTFTATPQTVSNNDPAWELNEADAAANNRLWSIRIVGEQLRRSVWNDARNSAVEYEAIDRTANVVDLITWTATAFNFVGLLQYGGIEVGYRGVPQNSQSGNYTTVAADAGCEIYHPSGAGAGDTFTIAANASVPYAIGTELHFSNDDSNAVTIAINSDTLTLAGTTSTGSRTLSQNGVATARKQTSTSWKIWGINLS